MRAKDGGAIVRAGLLALCCLAFFAVALVAGRLARPGSRVGWWLGRLFCRAVLRALRLRVELSGTPLGADQAGLVVANHLSWVDPLVLASVAPFSALAKSEVGTWPAIGAFARMQDTIFVDRTRRRTIPAVNRAMAARIAAGRSVLLFAEGTTFGIEARGPFKSSHFACLRDRMAADPRVVACTAQAVALTFSDPAAAWLGDDTLLPHLWTVLRRPPMTCRLVFGPPRAVPRGFDRKALARSMAAEVEGLLARPAAAVPREAACVQAATLFDAARAG